MKLLMEFIDKGNLDILKEDSDDKSHKIYRLKGPFMESSIKNKNGRTYPKELIEREVLKYNEEKISKGRGVGEMDHPENPTINLERISHVIESLIMKDTKGIGVARVIDTPMGKIARTLIDEGIILGVSTRGVGTLSEDGTVKSDFQLICVDLVFDPSAPSAFVESVLENKEWIMDGNKYVEVAIQNLQKKVEKKYDPKSVSGHVLTYMLDFIDEIKQKKLQ